MKKYYIIFFLLIINNFSFSQKIRIIDENSNPIIFVSIYNNIKSIGENTNSDGEAYLDKFKVNDTLTIQHPSFESITTSINKLKEENYLVVLKEKIFKIDEIVISANKWEQSKSDISSQILDLSENEIEYINPKTSADLLEETGQIFVQKSQLGGGSPMIRGFSANRILIVLDGVRLNNAIFRSGNLHNIISIDPNILEGAEVLFGPASVIYGSDAIGGVMDFHTKEPSFSSNKKILFKGQQLFKYYSASNSKHFNLNLNIGGRKISSISSISVNNYDDLRSGNKRPEKYFDFGKRTEYVEVKNSDEIVENKNYNIQKFSGYSQFNFVEKIKFNLSESFNLSYNFYLSNSSNIPRYDRLIHYKDLITPKYSEWYYGPQQFIMNKIEINLFGKKKFYDALSINISNQFLEESRNDRRFYSNFLRTRTEKVKIYSLNLDFDKEYNSKSEIYYGFEFFINKINSKAFIKDIVDDSKTNTSTRYPDGGTNYNSIAAYFSYKKNINEKLKINTGSRFSSVFLKSNFNSKEFFNFPYSVIKSSFKAINGNVGLIYLPNNNHQFNFLISTGFRAPNLDDIGKVFDSEPGNVIVPNKNLKPEYSINTELNLRKIISNKHKIEASLYYSRLINAMVRGNYQFNDNDSIFYDGELSRVQAILNTGKAYVWGYSILLDLNINKYIELRSSLTYNNGRDLINNNPLRHTSPIFGKTSLSYKRKKLHLEYYIKYNGKKEIKNLPPSELNKLYLYSPEGSLSWVTHNMKIIYKLKSIIMFTLSMENILNKHYRTYSSGISAPGRSINISSKIFF